MSKPIIMLYATCHDYGGRFRNPAVADEPQIIAQTTVAADQWTKLARTCNCSNGALDIRSGNSMDLHVIRVF